jgi:hypothetical protein
MISLPLPTIEGIFHPQKKMGTRKGIGRHKK